MPDYVTDTHALYWYLTANPLLGPNAQQIFLTAEQGRAIVHIPSIVLAELYYLNVKHQRPLEFSQEYQRLAEAGQFRFIDFQASAITHFDTLSAIPEMHDRLIACAAYELNCPLLTKDPTSIQSEIIDTVW